MCSSDNSGVGQPLMVATVPSAKALASSAARLSPTELGDLLHGVLDQLISADLTQLSSDEHQALLASLVRAEHRTNAATLHSVAAFDSADVASITRDRTTKRWLEHRTRLAPGSAAHMTRNARALRDHLPDTGKALGAGQISPQHASAITSVVAKVGVDHATVAEPILLSLARQHEPSVVRRATAQIHALVDPDAAEKALHNAYERRGLTLSVVGDHGYLDGIFDVESAELLRTALQPLMTRGGEVDKRSIFQRRADALLDIAKRQLDAGTLPELGGERPHICVVIDEAALRDRVGAVTLPWTGVAVPAEVVRRWSCHAQLTPVLASLLPPQNTTGAANGIATNGSGRSSRSAVMLGGGWLPLDVGRSSRLVTTGQAKALRVRDGGCVHPGCTRTSAYCDAHHVQHWADGGDTSLGNLVLLCRHHHRTLHAGLWSLVPNIGQPGRFWASTAGWAKPAQTAIDRSPPIIIDTAQTDDSAQAILTP
jgi:hypothetical protein